jgi:integrase
MSAYRDKRDGSWRYRKWITLPTGQKHRISGTPPIDTKQSAEHEERLHIERKMNPQVEKPTPTPGTKPKEVMTVAEFASQKFTNYKPGEQKPSEQYGKKRMLAAYIVPFFGHLLMSPVTLTQEHIDAFRAAQQARGMSKKTINNRLSVLKTLLRYAWKLRDSAIPCVDAKTVGELTFFTTVDEGKIHAVPMADVEKMLAAASDQQMRVAVLLATEAGLRVGEIRGLQRGDIKHGVNSPEIHVMRAIDQRNNQTDPKNWKTRVVPMSPRLVTEIAKLPKRGLWVLATPEGDWLEYERMLDAIHQLYAAAGVEIPVSDDGIQMPWHSLRHTFGTECGTRGVPVAVLMQMMGHKDYKTTLRYITVDESQKAAAIAMVFGQLGQQVGNRPGETKNAGSGFRS